jgi:hypothetical protein
VLGVLLVAIVDECQVQCVLLNNDVDAIVRRARPKLSMRWRYAEAQATVLLNDEFAVLDERLTLTPSWAATAATGST